MSTSDNFGDPAHEYRRTRLGCEENWSYPTLTFAIDGVTGRFRPLAARWNKVLCNTSVVSVRQSVFSYGAARLGELAHVNSCRSIQWLFSGGCVSAVTVCRFTADQYEAMIRAEIITEDDPIELLDGWITHKMTRSSSLCGLGTSSQLCSVSDHAGGLVRRIATACPTGDEHARARCDGDPG